MCGNVGFGPKSGRKRGLVAMSFVSSRPSVILVSLMIPKFARKPGGELRNRDASVVSRKCHHPFVVSSIMAFARLNHTRIDSLLESFSLRIALPPGAAKVKAIRRQDTSGSRQSGLGVGSVAAVR